MKELIKKYVINAGLSFAGATKAIYPGIIKIKRILFALIAAI
jgi:hypothetical protein